MYHIFRGFPDGSAGKESACNAGVSGLIPGSGISSGEGIGIDCSLQYSCLENTVDRGSWQAVVHGVTKSWTRLSDSAHAPTTSLPVHLSVETCFCFLAVVYSVAMNTGVYAPL